LVHAAAKKSQLTPIARLCHIFAFVRSRRSAFPALVAAAVFVAAKKLS
jgi:hypothetical protein